jgi:hypothetical protein
MIDAGGIEGPMNRSGICEIGGVSFSRNSARRMSLLKAENEPSLSPMFRSLGVPLPPPRTLHVSGFGRILSGDLRGSRR